MPLRQRMHAVPDPLLRAYYFDGSIEYLLCRHVDRIELFRELGDHNVHPVDLGATCLPFAALGHPLPRLQDERIDQDNSQIGVGLATTGKDVAIVRFPTFQNRRSRPL